MDDFHPYGTAASDVIPHVSTVQARINLGGLFYRNIIIAVCVNDMRIACSQGE